jgi:hypothetical protein
VSNSQFNFSWLVVMAVYISKKKAVPYSIDTKIEKSLQ